MAVTLQFKTDTLARWNASRYVLAIGEIGYATDANKIKIGDGVTEYADLPFASGGEVTIADIVGLQAALDAKIPLTQKAAASGVASLDANSRVVQPANLIHDGTAGREASTTPAANRVPVADSNGDLAVGFIPDLSATYAVVAKGVTGGDAHVHDVTQVSHNDLVVGAINPHTGYTFSPVIEDPYFDQAASILTFDDGVVDEKGVTWTVGGTPAVVPGKFRYGRRFEGNTYNPLIGYLANNYLRADFSGHDISTADFTIELWAKQIYNSPSDGGFNHILSMNPTASSNSGYRSTLLLTVGVYWQPTLRLFLHDSSGVDISPPGGWTITDLSSSVFSHIAICRSGTDMMVFVDGIKRLQITVPALYMGPSSSCLGAGSGTTDYGTNAINSSHCYIDDFRYYPGIAKYSTAGSVNSQIFTPPTLPYNRKRAIFSTETPTDGAYLQYKFGEVVTRNPENIAAISMSRPDELYPSLGEARWYATDRAVTVTEVNAWVETAPTGDSIHLLIKKNGVIFDDIEIPSGEMFATKVSTGTINIGDYITVDVNRVGSTTPGSTLTIRIVGDYA